MALVNGISHLNQGPLFLKQPKQKGHLCSKLVVSKMALPPKHDFQEFNGIYSHYEIGVYVYIYIYRYICGVVVEGT